MHITKRDYISLRSISLWIVVFGNIFWILDMLFVVRMNVEYTLLHQYRLLFVSAIISMFISLWLFPKILSNKLNYPANPFRSKNNY